jgi:uncharacterized protein (DUF433 family)/uncharacterized protein YuzE
MRITYDAQADAMYIYVQGRRAGHSGRMEELSDGFNVDYLNDGSVYGIEILDASLVVGFPRGRPEVSLEDITSEDWRREQEEQSGTLTGGGPETNASRQWIVTDPEHLGGQPRIAGTRISVAFLLESLATGMSVRALVEEYPTLTEETVRRTLEELARWEPLAREGLGEQS